MSPISHPSMKKIKDIKSAQSGQVFIVEDESLEENILDANEKATEEEHIEIVAPIKPPTAEKKRLIEDLVFLGNVSKDVDIYGHIFKISTLTHREHNTLMRELYKFGDSADIFTIRTLTLAMCIKYIDGVSFENIDVDGVFESVYDKKLAILDSMQKHIIEKLHDEYNELADRVEKELNKKESAEEIKN